MPAPRDVRFGGGATGADSSQIIDLRTLSRMAQAGPAGASASSLVIPRFAASDLTRMPASPTPLLPPPSLADLPLRSAAGDRAPLYALLAALTFAVVALSVLILLRPRPVLVVERPAALAVKTTPTAADEGDPPTAEPGGDARHDAAIVATPHERAEEGGDPDVQDAAESPEPSQPRARPRRSEATERRAVTARAPAPPKAPPAPKKPESKALTADCILGLADCGGASKPKPPEPSTPRSKPGAVDLPAKLTQAQIRGGLTPRKSAAKRCGSAHPAAAGEEVRVRLSIGGSGKVASATAQGDHAGTSLGACVASALAEATFPRFADPSMGVLFTVRM